MRPAVVSGFLICDDTVSSCTVVKNSASPKDVISVCCRVSLEEVDEDRADRIEREGGEEHECESRDEEPMPFLPAHQLRELLADHSTSVLIRSDG